MANRTYTDSALEAAVRAARSWRGVLRELGLAATSGAAIRSVKKRADQLGLDYRHFTGRRTWLDGELSKAVASSETWDDVARSLGVVSAASRATLKGHALRLGISTSHLKSGSCLEVVPTAEMAPDLERLPRSGSMLAAAWFTLCGFDVAWPLEPSPYDLLVTAGTEVKRVQVKTTRVRAGRSWTVWLSRSRGGRVVYDPAETDEFFVIDGDLSFYLLPVGVVAGLHAVTLSKYAGYRIGGLAVADELAGGEPDCG